MPIEVSTRLHAERTAKAVSVDPVRATEGVVTTGAVPVRRECAHSLHGAQALAAGVAGRTSASTRLGPEENELAGDASRLGQVAEDVGRATELE